MRIDPDLKPYDAWMWGTYVDSLLHLCARFFTQAEIQTLIFLKRKTLGFLKSVDQISRSQFHEQAGLKPSVLSEAMKILITDGIVCRFGEYRGRDTIFFYGINFRRVIEIINAHSIENGIVPLWANINLPSPGNINIPSNSNDCSPNSRLLFPLEAGNVPSTGTHNLLKQSVKQKEEQKKQYSSSTEKTKNKNTKRNDALNMRMLGEINAKLKGGNATQGEDLL